MPYDIGDRFGRDGRYGPIAEFDEQILDAPAKRRGTAVTLGAIDETHGYGHGARMRRGGAV